ncbi:MAG: hypothetical protein LBF68_02200, partial [Christensenellaceae bacterium]|nr:hypothetical protein [Christensenellaceae bacterium]
MDQNYVVDDGDYGTYISTAKIVEYLKRWYATEATKDETDAAKKEVKSLTHGTIDDQVYNQNTTITAGDTTDLLTYLNNQDFPAVNLLPELVQENHLVNGDTETTAVSFRFFFKSPIEYSIYLDGTSGNSQVTSTPNGN